ncbi:transposase [Nocardia colli]|uniref:Transposase n=1 Tax=Nocardia colli TaxID=2545717 RepID=A0A5N0EKR7_9NOCA|nr:RNA-guided endonuclease TnpB family protein [Nocardia colli]KAA8888615.1 transposase [Nocardia colli]
MDEVVRYSFRLWPGRTAESALLAEWGRCRFVWNEAVHQQNSRKAPTPFGLLSRQLTGARARNTWLRDGSQVAQQQTLRTYVQAVTQSRTVKGRGLPVFKTRKRARVSLEYTRRGFSIRNGRLVLAKGVIVPVVWSRELPSEPTSVRVTRDSVGHWYASFVVRRSAELPAAAEGLIGVDWGVRVTATTTCSKFDLPYRGHRARCAAELARIQRKMARRRSKQGPQSRGYQQAARQAARLHIKAARQSQHDVRTWVKAVVDHHELIAVEDFKPRFLAKSTMARKAADAAIGAAKRELIERGVRAGRRVVLVQPAYTSMTCSSCFARAKQRLELGERTFRCQGCGFSESRDRNAARVILAVAERGHIRVEDVRQSDHLLRVVGSVAV